MTLPNERYNAFKYAREFLRDLLDPKKTPKVPLSIRKRARSVLKHYAGDYDLERIAKKANALLINEDIK